MVSIKGLDPSNSTVSANCNYHYISNHICMTNWRVGCICFGFHTKEKWSKHTIMIRRIFFLGTHKRENITWNTIGKEKDWIYFAFSTLQKALEKKKKPVSCKLHCLVFSVTCPTQNLFWLESLNKHPRACFSSKSPQSWFI